MGKYLDNRLKYHTASRIGAQTGYSLAQALDPDGHIVRYDSVWVAPTTAFPMNVSKTTDPKDATDDLVEVFTGAKDPLADGAVLSATVSVNRSIGAGKVYHNSLYPAVELFYQVPMSGVANSDGADSSGKYQAYEIQESSKRVMDWVAPTAVINPDTTKPVAGFSGIAEANVNGTWTVLQKVPKWALATGTWEFAYISGILTFDPSVTPGDSGSASSVRFTGFKYIGDTADDKFTSIEDKLNNINLTWEEDPEVNSDLVTSFKIGESYFGSELTFNIETPSASETGTDRTWAAGGVLLIYGDWYSTNGTDVWTLTNGEGNKWYTPDENPFTSTNWVYGSSYADATSTDPVQFYDFVFSE